MERQTYKFLFMLMAIIALGISVSMAFADDCPEYERHKCAKQWHPIPTQAPKVCIHGEVKGPARITFQFLCDGKPIREAFSVNSPGRTWKIWVSKITFEHIDQCKGKIKICTGRGDIGVIFEQKDVAKHLEKGESCGAEPVLLYPHVYPLASKQ